ncbi:MAG: glycosyltransferase family 39 protein [Elusimicrobiales bacterium]|nr:glycosyltransferase family 39 protein [Elusimicrobiales bacterium]
MTLEKKWILAIALAALTLRIGFVFLGTGGSSIEYSPGQGKYVASTSYLKMANNWMQKNSYETTMTLIAPEGFTYKALRPPGFSAFIVIISKIHGINPILPLRIYLALLSMIIPLCVWLLTRNLWSWREGVLAFAWASFHPHFVFYSGQIVPETLFLVLSTSAFTLMMMEKNSIQAGIAGLLTGFACLCRSQFAGATLIGIIWPFLNPKLNVKKIWGVAFLAGFIIAVSPWWIRNYNVFDRFVPFSTEGGYTLWVGANPLADGGGDCPPSYPDIKLGELGMDKWHYEQGLSYLKENPKRTAVLAFQKLRRFWGIVPVKNMSKKIGFISLLSFLPLFIFAIAGFWFSRHRFKELLPIIGLISYYTFIQTIFPSMIRYRLVLEPFLIIMAAVAAIRLFDRAFNKTVK